MASFWEWAKLAVPSKPESIRGNWRAANYRRLTYVCGPEVRLREIVVQATASFADANERMVLVADGTNDGEIWEALNTYPVLAVRKNPALAPGEIATRVKPATVPVRRHITVRDAHKIKGWDSLPGWLDDMGQVSVTFDSPEPDFDRVLRPGRITCSRGHRVREDSEIVTVAAPRGRSKRYCKGCRQVRDVLVKSSRCVIVFATTPSTDLQKLAAEEFIKAYATLSVSITPLDALMKRVRYKVGLALDAMDKINAMAKVSARRGTLSTENVAWAESGDEETPFELALYGLSERKAQTFAIDVIEDEVPYMFERLDGWLGACARAKGMVLAGMERGRISRELDVNWYEAGRLMMYVRLYSDEVLGNAVEALSMADQNWGAGHRVGVLEELASRWCPA